MSTEAVCTLDIVSLSLFTTSFKPKTLLLRQETITFDMQSKLVVECIAAGFGSPGFQNPEGGDVPTQSETQIYYSCINAPVAEAAVDYWTTSDRI